MEPICPQCGDVGKTNTFVHCVKCLEFAIHRYCLDKIPESFDEFVHWVCDDCQDKLREKSAARYCDVIVLDSSDSEDVEIIEGTIDDVLKVETERIFKNLQGQRHDARGKLDSIDAVEADKDYSNEIDETTSLPREERESDQTLEMLEKEVSSEDITLKEFAKIKKNERRVKNKHRVEEPCYEKDCHALGGDISAKRSHKKHKKVDSSDQAVSPKEKKSLKPSDKRRVSKKSHESVKHPSTKKNRVLFSNESSGALKKHKTDPLKKGNLQERIAEKDSVLRIEDNLGLILDNRLDEVSDKVVSSDPCNETVGKNAQAKVSRRRLMVSDIDAFLEAVPIWCGGLHISSKHHSIRGLVAHISSKAHRKVYETSREFPAVIDIELCPKTEVWPKSFEILEPSLESVALYFFASEDGVLVFDNLVKDMILEDLSLKAVLRDAELLIFASTELPIRYSRSKGKFYLWGVFRGRTRSLSESDSLGNAMEDKATKSRDTLRENNGIY